MCFLNSDSLSKTPMCLDEFIPFYPCRREHVNEQTAGLHIGCPQIGKIKGSTNNLSSFKQPTSCA